MRCALLNAQLRRKPSRLSMQLIRTLPAVAEHFSSNSRKVKQDKNVSGIRSSKALQAVTWIGITESA
jgi:hypothetical protein